MAKIGRWIAQCSAVWNDLYAEGFNPVQPVAEAANTASDDSLVEQHCSDLQHANLVLIFHPNWWRQLPAILKGWIDRVFRLDAAYTYPAGVGFEGVPVGLLKSKLLSSSIRSIRL